LLHRVIDLPDEAMFLDLKHRHNAGYALSRVRDMAQAREW